MKLKPYPEYKDSGVEWIDEIPNNWELTKIGHHTSIKRGAGYQLLNLDEAEKTVECIRINDFHKFNPIKVEYFPELNQYKIKKDDILIAGTGATAGITLHIDDFNEKGYIHSYNVINIRPNSINSKFLFYLMNSELIFIQENMLFTGSAQHFLDIFSIANLKITFPLIDEQEKIVSFLDKKTSEIDLTIEKDTRLIELLKEKRTALINHVVTTGRDPTVKMKDSGVEWIGEIPEDWLMLKIKHLAGNCSNPVQTGPFGAQLHADDYVEKGIPLILIRNVNHGRINLKNIPFVSESDALRLSMYGLNVGDIVFSRVGSLGRAALVTENEEGWLISGQMLRLRLQDKRIHAPYLVYIFQSDLSNEYVSLESVGSTRESLNTEILSNLPFPLPSKEKQEDLVEYLDNETSQIDLIIQKVENKIIYLEEYKKSLIHHVVTGKVDVREVAV